MVQYIQWFYLLTTPLVLTYESVGYWAWLSEEPSPFTA